MLHPVLAAERKALLALFGASAVRLAELMPKVEQDADIEALHQLRVELRRTRSALQAMRGAIPVPDAEHLIAECRWLAGHGSGLRDLDVLLERLPDYLGETPDPADPAVRQLLREIGKLRARERRAMLGAFRSRRGHRLVVRLEALAGIAVHAGGWAGEAALAKAVRRSLQRLRRYGASLGDDAAPEAWHEIRKRAKRARYLLELYRAVDEARPLREATQHARRLQTAFGDYQDFFTHLAVLEPLLAGAVARGDSASEDLLQRLLVNLQSRIPRALVKARNRLEAFLDAASRRKSEKRLAPSRQPGRPMLGNGGYCHGWIAGEPCGLPVGKVVCVGRNYAAHAAELGNPVPDTPLLFIKPPSSVVDIAPTLRLPVGRGSVHHETEIAVLVVRELSHATPEQAFAAIGGLGVALDLTLREVQDALKAKGQPWEISKGFDGACALSPFLPMGRGLDLGALQIRLVVNGRRRQFASSAQMLTPIVELLCLASRHFTLWPGDVLLTGTPAGVGALVPGDRLLAEVAGVVSVRSIVG